MITLLPDQQDSIDKVTASARRGNKYILLQGATGSGKSVIGSKLAQQTLAKDNSIWFCVPRKDLIDQMSATFNEFNIPHSFIAAGRSLNPYAKAHICSLDTIKSRLDRMTPPKLALIDETHYGGAGLDAIIAWLKNHSALIIGLSATPWRLDGRGLGCYYQDMVCGPRVRELINMKRLADYRAFAPSAPDLSRVAVSQSGDFVQSQLAERMEQDRVLIGDAVGHYKKHAYGRLGVTFAVSVKHSQLLAQAYRDAGIPAMHMDGETPMDERKRIAKAYANRELLQLCNAELLTFGYDLATASGVKGVRIEGITDCQPTKSLAKQRQKNGRGLRYGEQPAFFFDHANNFNEHGLPCADIDWTLENRMKSTRGSADRAAPVIQCAGCFFVYPPSQMSCPSCGLVRARTEREIEQREGELQEIQIQQEKKAARMEVVGVKTMDELRRIQRERGYKEGWVLKMAQIKGISQ